MEKILYMMLNIIWLYLFIGTIIGLFMEIMIRITNNSVNSYERFWLISSWPFIVLIFLYFLLKHLFYNINDE